MKIWKYRKIILSADESIIILIKRFWWTLMNKHEKTSLRDRTRQNYHSERFMSTANTFIKDAYGHLLCTLTNWTVILLQNLCKNQSCWWHWQCHNVTLWWCHFKLLDAFWLLVTTNFQLQHQFYQFSKVYSKNQQLCAFEMSYLESFWGMKFLIIKNFIWHLLELKDIIFQKCRNW